MIKFMYIEVRHCLSDERRTVCGADGFRGLRMENAAGPASLPHEAVGFHKHTSRDSRYPLRLAFTLFSLRYFKYSLLDFCIESPRAYFKI